LLDVASDQLLGNEFVAPGDDNKQRLVRIRLEDMKLV
jgi:hypothetical protein